MFYDSTQSTACFEEEGSNRFAYLWFLLQISLCLLGFIFSLIDLRYANQSESQFSNFCFSVMFTFFFFLLLTEIFIMYKIIPCFFDSSLYTWYIQVRKALYSIQTKFSLI